MANRMSLPKQRATTSAAPVRERPHRRLRIGLQLPWRFETGRRIIGGIADYAEQRGNWDFDWNMTFDPNFLKLKPFDGLIAMALSAADAERYYRQVYPVVLTTRSPGRRRLPLITFDDYGIGKMAAEYLLNLGYDKLAYFARSAPHPDLRLDGFRDTAARSGITIRAHARRIKHHTAVLDSMPSLDRICEWLKSLPSPIAMFTYNDADALEIASAARHAGVRIPEEIALLGVDNDTVLGRLCHVPLSSIDPGAHNHGYQAAALLDRIIAGGKPDPVHIKIAPIGVVTRRSTDTLAVADPDVALAIRIIREEACDGLRTQSVIDRVSISRTSLEARFKKHFNRSVREEIFRVRMEKAMHLLRSTDMDMPQITDLSGFRYPSQVSHIFRRQLKMSPREYRQRSRSAN